MCLAEGNAVLHDFYSRLFTLGFLPKIPFKLTQSIHVALQKTAILTKKMSKYSVFNTETNKGNIGLYFENNEKNC